MSKAQRSFSVNGKSHARWKAIAAARGVSLGQLVEQALAGPWTLAEAETARVAGLAAQRNGNANRGIPRTPWARIPIDVDEGTQSLVADRVVRMRELHGVDMSPGEIFDRAVCAALDAEGAP